MTDAWQIRWIDQSLHSGDSASDVLASIASRMWNEEDAAKPKEAISYRVWTILRGSIDPALPDDEFLTKCAEVGIAEVISKPH